MMFLFGIKSTDNKNKSKVVQINENAMEVHENIKNKNIIGSSNPTSGYISKGNKFTISEIFSLP
jgi:hypothetical protein